MRITHLAIRSRNAELRSDMLGDALSAPFAPPWEQHACLWKHPEVSLRYRACLLEAGLRYMSLHIAKRADAKLSLMQKHLAEHLPGSAAVANPLNNTMMLKPGSNDGNESSLTRDRSTIATRCGADTKTVSAAGRWKRCGAHHCFAVQLRGAIMRAAFVKIGLKVRCALPAKLCVRAVTHNHAGAACKCRCLMGLDTLMQSWLQVVAFAMNFSLCTRRM
jgi:hypothetical protein